MNGSTPGLFPYGYVEVRESIYHYYYYYFYILLCCKNYKKGIKNTWLVERFLISVYKKTDTIKYIICGYKMIFWIFCLSFLNTRVSKLINLLLINFNIYKFVWKKKNTWVFLIYPVNNTQDYNKFNLLCVFF